MRKNVITLGQNGIVLFVILNNKIDKIVGAIARSLIRPQFKHCVRRTQVPSSLATVGALQTHFSVQAVVQT